MNYDTKSDRILGPKGSNYDTKGVGVELNYDTKIFGVELNYDTKSGRICRITTPNQVKISNYDTKSGQNFELRHQIGLEV
jgi:hypothetical protein